MPFINSMSFGSGTHTVVGVAGWVGTWELWQRPMEAISRDARAIAYDHYGAGLSDADPELLTFEAQVDALFDVMDGHDVDRCILAGESMGAAVAIEAALRVPERFTRLVLVAGQYTNFDHPAARAFADLVRADFESVIPPFVGECIPEADGDRARRWLRRILRAADPEVAAQLIEAMYDIDLRPRLSELEVPVVLVHGAQDLLPGTRMARAHEAAALIPDCRLRVLPDAGHVPTLTRPEAVVEAIRTGLQSASDTGPPEHTSRHRPAAAMELS